MQSRNLILILSIGALAAFGGCERHSWEKTRVLHQSHGGEHSDEAHHGEGEHAKTHDDSHEKGEGEHGKKEAHPEPKAEKAKGETRKL